MFWSTANLRKLAATLDFKAYSAIVYYNYEHQFHYIRLITDRGNNQYHTNDFYLGHSYIDAETALINLADYRSNP